MKKLSELYKEARLWGCMRLVNGPELNFGGLTSTSCFVYPFVIETTIHKKEWERLYYEDNYERTEYHASNGCWQSPRSTYVPFHGRNVYGRRYRKQYFD